MRHVLTLLIGLSVSSAASAASWVFVGNCGEGNQVKAYSYDSASIRRQRGNLLVRVRGDYSQSAGSPASEARLLWSVDCANRTFVERSRTEHRANGSVVANYRKATGSMAISAGSIADKLYGKICA